MSMRLSCHLLFYLKEKTAEEKAIYRGTQRTKHRYCQSPFSSARLLNSFPLFSISNPSWWSMSSSLTDDASDAKLSLSFATLLSLSISCSSSEVLEGTSA
ncbi:hypothetical protein I7I53_11981 [Histoplasma capsulatum var. duboisii H88]|uniref:Uncharacterized protein n=1 Tax=Ajellomyces capsulatus (strain H88) TaxID=544711 RepID=A0A8A1LU36_AJEC8|nr:hypothetical protein I7I53_11981 [Histoplasma capsulatum var. duboisii H88]